MSTSKDPARASIEYTKELRNELNVIIDYILDFVCKVDEKDENDVDLTECEELAGKYVYEKEELDSIIANVQKRGYLSTYDHSILEDTVDALVELNLELEEFVNKLISPGDFQEVFSVLVDELKTQLNNAPPPNSNVKEALLSNIDAFREEAQSALDSLRICEENHDYVKVLNELQIKQCEEFQRSYRDIIKQYTNLYNNVNNTRLPNTRALNEYRSVFKKIYTDTRRLNVKVVDFLVKTPFPSANWSSPGAAELRKFRPLEGRIDAKKKFITMSRTRRNSRRRKSGVAPKPFRTSRGNRGKRVTKPPKAQPPKK